MSRPKAARPLTDLLLIFAGPFIWFGHFSFIYGAETLICLGPAELAGSRMVWTYALATLVTLAGLSFLAVMLARDARGLSRIGLGLTLLSIAAVIFTAIPVAILPACLSSG